MLWRPLCITQFYLLLIVYTYLGLTPHPENSVPVFNDLLMHFVGYTAAAFSISFASPHRAIWQRASFLILFSFAIEVGQFFNPPRTFNLTDMVANSSGVALGLCAVLFLTKYVPLFSNLLYWKCRTKETPLC